MSAPLTEAKRGAIRRKAEDATTWSKAEVADDPALAARKLNNLGRAVLALLDERLTPSEAGAIQAVAEVERLRQVLEVIATWDPKTFPRVPDRDDPEKTYSYGFAYGSNGERDFMRKVARDALDATPPAEPVFTAAQVREAVAVTVKAELAVGDRLRAKGKYDRAAESEHGARVARSVLHRLGIK